MKVEDLPVVSADARIQAAYARMRLDGQSHSIAEMCAFRRAPGIGMTDSIFMQDHWDGRSIADPFTAGIYRSIARANGVSPDGKTYCSQLASFPGDPTAWVDSVANVKEVATMKGLKLEGGIEYTPPDYDERVDDEIKPYRVSDEIVDEHMAAEAEASPEVAAEWEAKPQVKADRKERLTELFSGAE